jgi:hypothetical protein
MPPAGAPPVPPGLACAAAGVDAVLAATPAISAPPTMPVVFRNVLRSLFMVSSSAPLAAIAAPRRGNSIAARTIAQAGQGFSNPVVSLSNHGDARAAVLRQAQDEVCMRGNVFSEEGYGQQRQCPLDLHA